MSGLKLTCIPADNNVSACIQISNRSFCLDFFASSLMKRHKDKVFASTQTSVERKN